jgi:hypothetical protein
VTGERFNRFLCGAASADVDESRLLAIALAVGGREIREEIATVLVAPQDSTRMTRIRPANDAVKWRRIGVGKGPSLSVERASEQSA